MIPDKSKKNVWGRMAWSRRGALGAAVFGAFALEGAYGCVGETGTEDFIEENIGEVEDAVYGSDAPAPAPTTDVGVIRELGATCPGDAIKVHLDDEDDDNDNDRFGWMGDVGDYHNTDLWFCKVSGGAFKALSGAAADPSRRYAVLRLGAQCPNGSVPFERYFDNEDVGNENEITVNGISVASAGPNTRSTYDPTGTWLHFCLFDGSTAAQSSMSSFPGLGFDYGVFAPADFSKAVGGWKGGKGFVYTDDEDYDNHNTLSNWSSSVTSIIDPTSDGRNTYLRTAKVAGMPARGHEIEDRVGDGHWMDSTLQFGVAGVVRVHTRLTCWNDLLGFTGGSFIVVVDIAKNPIWIGSIHEHGLNAKFLASSPNTRNVDWTETLPSSVRTRARGIALIQLQPHDLEWTIHVEFEDEKLTWDVGVDKIDVAPSHDLLAGKELTSGWNDVVFTQYLDLDPMSDDYYERETHLNRIKARVASTATVW